MSNNCFHQYVHNATTDRGTMIDLIFARHLESIVYTVDAYDVYYSDHDAVYCKLISMSRISRSIVQVDDIHIQNFCKEF